MKVLLTTSLLVLTVYNVHCMNDANNNNNNNNNNGQQSSTGNPGGNTNTPPKFDKTTLVRNGVGDFMAQLNHNLLYIRDYVMANIGEVGHACGCQPNVLAPFLPPFSDGSGQSGGNPGGPVPPGNPGGAPSPPGSGSGAAATLGNAGNLNPRGGTPPKNG
ncbi:uncharacterized protein [Littorina saxatilis]|uniref:Uncharacterized protein n=1 Tax=Littorina saxatilis TaxID=31220 RepID=A0AAN9GPB9_9CAEN